MGRLWALDAGNQFWFSLDEGLTWTHDTTRTFPAAGGFVRSRGFRAYKDGWLLIATQFGSSAQAAFFSPTFGVGASNWVSRQLFASGTSGIVTYLGPDVQLFADPSGGMPCQRSLDKFVTFTSPAPGTPLSPDFWRLATGRFVCSSNPIQTSDDLGTTWVARQPSAEFKCGALPDGYFDRGGNGNISVDANGDGTGAMSVTFTSPCVGNDYGACSHEIYNSPFQPDGVAITGQSGFSICVAHAKSRVGWADTAQTGLSNTLTPSGQEVWRTMTGVFLLFNATAAVFQRSADQGKTWTTITPVGLAGSPLALSYDALVPQFPRQGTRPSPGEFLGYGGLGKKHFIGA